MTKDRAEYFKNYHTNVRKPKQQLVKAAKCVAKHRKKKEMEAQQNNNSSTNTAGGGGDIAVTGNSQSVATLTSLQNPAQLAQMASFFPAVTTFQVHTGPTVHGDYNVNSNNNTNTATAGESLTKADVAEVLEETLEAKL